MSDSNDTPTAVDGASDRTADVSAQAFSSNYKVLGYQQSGSGETYGVLGQVDSAGGYGLGTPDRAWAGGGLETTLVRTNDQDLHLQFGTQSVGDASNLIAGHADNGATSGVVGATIGGGGYSVGGGPTSLDLNPDTRANLVYDHYGTVGGGEQNRAGSYDQTLSSGAEEATDDPEPAGVDSSTHATVAGGHNNQARGPQSTVGGGQGNEANAQYATIAGGKNSDVTAKSATVAGGQANEAAGQYATVGGGWANEALGTGATVSGGAPPGDFSTRNIVHDDYGTVGGGGNNNAGAAGTSGTSNAVFATVPGGRANVADGAYSLAAGRGAKAGGNAGAFVWGDSSSSTVTASGMGEVRFQASGGFVIESTVEVQVPQGLPASSGSSVGINGTGHLVDTGASSLRYKTDVEPLVSESGNVLDLEPRRYTYEETGDEGIGLIAEETDETVPDLVVYDEAGRPDGIRYDRLGVFLLPEVRRSHERIEDLETETEDLRAENEDLRKRLAMLEEQVGVSEATGDVDGPAPADD